jgi:hypothetical protein
LSHAQSQALQTQSQALQTIQDQQGKIITALLPLLPLLQAVPLHIDAVKDKIGETINNAQVTAISRDSENLVGSGPLSSPPASSERIHSKRKRYSIALGEESSDVDSLRPSNRVRVDNDPDVLSSTSTHVSRAPFRAQPIENSVRGYKMNNARLPLPGSVAPSRSIQNQTNRRPSIQNSIISSGFLTSSSKEPNSQTPRRPLADIFRPRNPGSVVMSSEDRYGAVTYLNSINRSRPGLSNAAPSVSPSIARKISLHAGPAVPSLPDFAAPTQVQVQILTDSMGDSVTNSEEPSSENLLPTLVQHPLSSLTSDSTDGSSGSSSDRMLTSDPKSIPAPAPLLPLPASLVQNPALPLLPPRNILSGWRMTRFLCR